MPRPAPSSCRRRSRRARGWRASGRILRTLQEIALDNQILQINDFQSYHAYAGNDPIPLRWAFVAMLVEGGVCEEGLLIIASITMSLPGLPSDCKGKSVLAQLWTLTHQDLLRNCEGMMPGETCYVLQKDTIQQIIQYISDKTDQTLQGIANRNAAITEQEEKKQYLHLDRAFKKQVEGSAVRAMGRGLCESLQLEIDLRGIALQRRVGRAGVQLHPFRLELQVISRSSMKEVGETSFQLSLERMRVNFYWNDTVQSFLRRVGRYILKKETPMRLYAIDSFLFQHYSFSRMAEYFCLKEDLKNCNNQLQTTLHALQRNRDYLLQFFPGKMMRNEGVSQLRKIGDVYMLELGDDGWVFPQQPPFSVAKNCRFCMMRMQLYLNFACSKCRKDFLLCSRACHYQYLCEHQCRKEAQEEIANLYGEEYLTSETNDKGSDLDVSFPQPPVRDSHPPDSFGGGLANISNSCYINASIQNLARTSLTFHILAQEDAIVKDKSVVAKAYLALLKKLEKTTAQQSLSLATMRKFKAAVDKKIDLFKGEEQHDAHEFLTLFLDCLSEQLNSSREGMSFPAMGQKTDEEGKACQEWCNFIARNNSPIVQLFYGQLKSQIHCPNCNTNTQKFDSFNIISLSIPQHSSKTNIGFFFEYHLFKDKIKLLDFQASGETVDDLIRESLPSLGFTSEKRKSIKAFKLGFKGQCREIEGSMKIAQLKQQLGVLKTRENQLFLIEAPAHSFRLFCQFVRDGKAISYKRPLFFPKSSHRTMNTDLYSAVAEYLLGMARHYLQKGRWEEMNKRINKDYDEYFIIRVVVDGKGVALQPDIKVSPLLSKADLLEVAILHFENRGEAEYQLTNSLVRLNRFVQVQQAAGKQQLFLSKAPLRLQDCLREQFSRSELLSNGNEWFCGPCGERRRARQTIHLYKASRYLFLQVKRFRQGSDGSYHKNNRPVSLEMELDLGEILQNPHLPEEYYRQLSGKQREQLHLPAQIDLTPSRRYQLIGLVLHEGSIESGHYTAVCRGSGWRRYSDERVEEVADVGRLLGEEETMEQLYILLYERVN